jgi:hypothetical protein
MSEIKLVASERGMWRLYETAPGKYRLVLEVQIDAESDEQAEDMVREFMSEMVVR